jgi:hypothetical protein
MMNIWFGWDDVPYWFQVLQGCKSPVMRVISHDNNVG